MKEFRISGKEAGRRLDKWLVICMPNAGKGFLYKMMRKKNITVNGAKVSGNETLAEGDVVRIFFSDDTFEKFSAGTSAASAQAEVAYDRSDDKKVPVKKVPDIPVIYEDDDIVIVNKPAGLLSQKSVPSDVSVNDFIAGYARSGDTFKPAICHRLDRNTSGVLVCGVSYRGLKVMSELIKGHTVIKEYVCLVRGHAEKHAVYTDHLLKDEAANTVKVDPKGQEAVLEADALCYGDDVTLVKIRLITGRSHQIRVQMSHHGHAVLGDVKYGSEKITGVKTPVSERHIRRPMLHAFRLTFPADAEVGPRGASVTAPLPADMLKVMKGAGIEWQPGNPED